MTSQRDVFAAWDAAIAVSGLPFVVGDPAKPKARVMFGAPLTAGIAADGELLEIVLTQRLPAWQVRESLIPSVPAGWSLVDLADVWLGGPALAGRVAAADYRIVLGGAPGGTDAAASAAVASAAEVLIASRDLPRARAKGDGVVRYDLRPLLVDVTVVDAGLPVTIRVRTRFHADLGTGRPEEVVLALGEVLGVPLTLDSIVRERLVLADDMG